MRLVAATTASLSAQTLPAAMGLAHHKEMKLAAEKSNNHS